MEQVDYRNRLQLFLIDHNCNKIQKDTMETGNSGSIISRATGYIYLM